MPFNKHQTYRIWKSLREIDGIQDPFLTYSHNPRSDILRCHVFFVADNKEWRGIFDVNLREEFPCPYIEDWINEDIDHFIDIVKNVLNRRPL